MPRKTWRICLKPEATSVENAPKMASSRGTSRIKRWAKNEIPYSAAALRQDLSRVRAAWEHCQATRDRNAIYGYLTAVFDLVSWWAATDRAISRARWAMRLQNADASRCEEAFAAIIVCTSDPGEVDKRTRSKWSRVLRYSAEYKPYSEPLASFIRRRGGINKCAFRFARCLGR
jgi:hypothetical protein